MEQEASKTALPADAIAALAQGNKIGAIKAVREAHHTGLKEAKDRVEAYLDANPATQAAFTAAAGQSGKQALWWLAVIIGGAVLACFLLVKH